MTQILDPLPADGSETIICCYLNATSKIQIARVANISNWYFERVVFPGQRLIFETPMEGLLEIHTGLMASAILSDTIPCERLAVQKTLEQEVMGRGSGSDQDSLEEAAVLAVSADRIGMLSS